MGGGVFCRMAPATPATFGGCLRPACLFYFKHIFSALILGIILRLVTLLL
jgi:hypothetical protein